MDQQVGATGPQGFENWRAAHRGEAVRHLFEIALYSDSEVTGHWPADDRCPYGFLNALAFEHAGALRHVATLRVRIHREESHPVLPSMDKTDTSRYHGGWLADEIAALAGLLLGIRLRAGDITRDFVSDDPLGQPRAERRHFALPVGRERRRVVRVRSGNWNSMLRPLLEQYPALTVAHAVALVRAARLYQNAMWLADAEPELSWLMLVSALEVVAAEYLVSRGEPVDALIDAMPDLVRELRAGGHDEALGIIARHSAPRLRATSRFIQFTVTHLPGPPPERSAAGGHVDWSPSAMRKMLSKIYDHRSKALHSGIPFPRPMCEPPWEDSERPTSLASATNEGAWLAADTPMLLQTFEHITRGAIVNWWCSLLPPVPAI